MVSPISHGHHEMSPISAKANVSQADGAGGVSSSTRVRTLEDLKNASQELHHKILMGLAMATCRQSERAQQRQRRINKEYRT